MYKKTDLTELNIPNDDVECWERYPKHRWVYDLSRLLDSQNIKWSPYLDGQLSEMKLNMTLRSRSLKSIYAGYIYIKEPTADKVCTEVIILKGDVKAMYHVDPASKTQIQGLIGEIELRICAFVTLHFQKFTGIISVETYGNEIHSIRLRPLSELSLVNDPEIIKVIKRVYKKLEVTINGPTDQVRHESFAS